MTDVDLPVPEDDGTVNDGGVIEDHSDLVIGMAVGEDPLDHVSDEDPDHDPFADYPAAQDATTGDDDSVDEPDTEGNS